MKDLILRIGPVAIVVMASFPALAAADREVDEAAIRDVVEKQQQQAWNQHDAKAYAALFAEDGDVVNVVGWWWKDRKEIESKLTDAFAFVFRESTLTITRVDMRFLTPEIAVAHVRWTMTGAKTPPTIPEPREGLQTILLQKLDGKWMIAAFQNTNYVPEVPFPKGPGATVPASSHAVFFPFSASLKRSESMCEESLLSAYLPLIQILAVRINSTEGIAAYELTHVKNDKFNRKNHALAAVREPLCPLT